MSNDPLLDEITSTLDECVTKMHEAFDGISKFLADPPFFFPDWAVEAVAEKWNEFNADVTVATADFSASVNGAGSPYSLRAAADEWTTAIGGALSGLSTTVDTRELASDDKFSGLSATAYTDKAAPKQMDAIAAIEALPAILAECCNETADSINACLGKWIVALAGLITAIASIVVGVATAPTGLGPLICIGLAIGGVATFVGAATVAELDSASAIEGIEGKFLAAQSDWTGFDIGTQAWPKAVIA